MSRFKCDGKVRRFLQKKTGLLPRKLRVISQLCRDSHPKHTILQCFACLSSPMVKGDQGQQMLPELPEACQEDRTQG